MAASMLSLSSLLFFFFLISSTISRSRAINDSDFKIVEATVEEIQAAFSRNDLTSSQLVDLYLRRIQKHNPVHRAVLEVNPDARDQAEQADRERRSGELVGALHGIPVMLKDSIGIKDKMNTTAGSYALLGRITSRSSEAPENWCARGGYATISKKSQENWREVVGEMKESDEGNNFERRLAARGGSVCDKVWCIGITAERRLQWCNI
ncbi:hypothetical protein PIB30_019902 [Stylosanthes scabra]|uniref:Amidase domain-containing protein n=1 Tax=Stylosanthes scabra TaxID=79078 RepID=A0ABU6U7A9_9FABA|nr:hypothetical protein [Stylosanthes scabra]